MRIGPYEIEDELGRGGMGVVYRTRDAGGRGIALKVVRPRSPEEYARFTREARLLGRMGEHEGFVPLLASGEDGDRLWLAMPLIEGGTLAKRLESGPLGLSETRALGIELATALGRAHAAGVVHRDVKPDNVLFTRSGTGGDRGRPLISDLGLAKHFRHDVAGASLTIDVSKADQFRGTAGYMAPEQMQDALSVGPEVDVFALGAVLYECLAGEPAFSGGSLFELMARLEDGPAPLRSRRPEVPVGLADTIERCLARDPSERPRDGAALARALLAERSPPRGRRALLAGALGGVAVALAAIAAVSWTGGSAPRVPPAPASPPLPAPAPAPSSVPRPPAPPTGPPPGTRSDASVAEARALRDRIALRSPDERDASIDDLERLLALEKDAPERGRLVQLLFDRAAMNATIAGDLKKALADLSRRLELEPRNAELWGHRADTKLFTDDLRGAIADYSQGIALAPGNGRFYRHRGECWMRLKNDGKALADLERAVELAPDTADSAEARALLKELRARR